MLGGAGLDDCIVAKRTGWSIYNTSCMSYLFGTIFFKSTGNVAGSLRGHIMGHAGSPTLRKILLHENIQIWCNFKNAEREGSVQVLIWSLAYHEIDYASNALISSWLAIVCCIIACCFSPFSVWEEVIIHGLKPVSMETTKNSRIQREMIESVLGCKMGATFGMDALDSRVV